MRIFINTRGRERRERESEFFFQFRGFDFDKGTEGSNETKSTLFFFTARTQKNKEQQRAQCKGKNGQKKGSVEGKNGVCVGTLFRTKKNEYTVQTNTLYERLLLSL